MRLRWNPPESDGGSRVLAYVVERCDASLGAVPDVWERVGSSTQCELLVRLTKSRIAQKYRVRAENALGAGEPSDVLLVDGERSERADIDLSMRLSARTTQKLRDWSGRSAPSASPSPGLEGDAVPRRAVPARYTLIAQLYQCETANS